MTTRLTGETATKVEAKIREWQEAAGLTEFQGWIDSGLVWMLEGHQGREAMRALETGACFLPTTRHRDFWGNTVPSRDDLQPGTNGTLENSVEFYGGVILEVTKKADEVGTHGRCDACGAPCDADGCTKDRGHQIANTTHAIRANEGPTLMDLFD